MGLTSMEGSVILPGSAAGGFQCQNTVCSQSCDSVPGRLEVVRSFQHGSYVCKNAEVKISLERRCCFPARALHFLAQLALNV